MSAEHGGRDGGSGGVNTVTYYPTLTSPDDPVIYDHATILDLICEGQIYGLATGDLRSVYLNKVPVQNADMTLNTTDVYFAVVNGSNSQPVIAGISDVESEATLQSKVWFGNPVTGTVSNLSATSCRVKVSVPALYSGTGGTQVRFRIDVNNGSGWTTAVFPDSSSVGGGSTTLAVDGTAKTIRRNTGSFIADGYYLGQTVKTSGFVSTANNQNGLVVTAITDAVLTFANAVGLVTSAAPLGYGAYIQSATVDGSIKGKFTSKYIKGFKIPLTGTGPWSVRVVRLTADSTDATTLQNDLYFESLTTIVDQKFRYPYSAMVAASINSYNYSSIPPRAYLMKLALIQVPANYTPASYDSSTGVWTPAVYATTGPGTDGGVWDGTFKTIWSDNPAWCFYDLATNARYGAGSYLSAANVDKWSLYTIGQYCDGMVPDGLGGTEPRFRCNCLISDKQDGIKLLSYLASVFRGMVYWASGTVFAIQDVDGTPAVQFTCSDVIDGKFSYQGTARRARHTACVVYWNDPSNYYVRTPEYVEDEDGIARYGLNQVEVTAIGCTSQGQARRLGLWTLLSEVTETETVTFETGLEGIRVRPGEIIQVHDQFRQGTRSGGRTQAATTTQITLDSPVTLVSGVSYQISCMLPSGALETRIVSVTPGSTSTITTTTAFSEAPQVMGQWLMVSGDGLMTSYLYRVVSISESDGAYTVVALLHNAAKYAQIETGLSVISSGSTTVSPFKAVANLAASAKMATIGGQPSLVLAAWWDPIVAATGYTAVCSVDSGPWLSMTVSGNSAELVGAVQGTYRIRVVAQYAGGVSSATEISVSAGGIVLTAPTTCTLTKATVLPGAVAGERRVISTEAVYGAGLNGTQTTIYSPVYLTQRQTYVDAVNPASLVSGFRLIFSTSNDPTDTSKYLIDPIDLGTSEIGATISYVPQSNQTIYAAVRTSYTTDDVSGWTVSSGVAVVAVATDVATNDINSPNALANGDKITLMNEWAQELQTQGILESGSTVDHSAYDAAITALSAGLISYGAPSNWASIWPDGTTLSHAGIMVALAGWWATIVSAREALKLRITEAKAAAVEAAAIASAATTALQKSAYTTDGVHIQGTTLAGGTITAAAMANSNSTNLIPNGNSETPAPAGGWPSGAYEAVGLHIGGGFAYQGNNCRVATQGQILVIAPLIQVNSGDQFYLEAYIASGGAGAAYVYARGFDANQTQGPNLFSISNDSTSYAFKNGNFVIPSGTCFLQLFIYNPNTGNAAFDNLYCGRVIVAGQLAANSVVAGNVAAQAITAQNLTLANIDNLIPNPNSEQAAPAGGWPAGAYESVALAPGGYEGTNGRWIPAGQVYKITPLIPVSTGENYYLEAMVIVAGGSTAYLELRALDASGNDLGNLNSVGLTSTVGQWTKKSGSWNVQPIGGNTVSFIQVWLYSSTNVAGFDNFYLRRCTDASMIVDGTITTLFARFGNWLASTNNNHAYVSNSVAPVGIYMSGQPFTTYFTDPTLTAGVFQVGEQYQIVSVGSTSWSACGSNWIGTVGAVGSIFTATSAGSGTGTANHVATDCLAEFGGSLNIGGHKAATLAEKVFSPNKNDQNAGGKFLVYPAFSGTSAMRMQGTGFQFTPKYSGSRVLVAITGWVRCKAHGGEILIRYGVGTPPSPLAPLAGSAAMASAQEFGANGTTPDGFSMPLSMIFLMPAGLAPGTTYWIDLAAAPNYGIGETFIVGGLSIVALEL